MISTAIVVCVYRRFLREGYMAFNLSGVLGFIFICGIILLLILLLGKLIRPSVYQSKKATTYECGEKPIGSAWFNFNNRFYIIALVFVLFDVEVALVVPAVLIFRKFVSEGQGMLAFAEVFVFLAILFVALIYVWARGDIDWDKDVKDIKRTSMNTGAEENGN